MGMPKARAATCKSQTRITTSTKKPGSTAGLVLLRLAFRRLRLVLGNLSQHRVEAVFGLVAFKVASGLFKFLPLRDIVPAMELLKPPGHTPSLSFYGDASSKERAYMVAGGFAVSGNRINEIEDAIATLRDDAGIRSEFHWADYRGGRKRPAYEALVRYAFDLINKRQAALHVIVAKFGGYNHRQTKGENHDTSVNRMYYQLFLHRVCRYYGKKRQIHIRLDAGNDSDDICRMRNELCAASYKTYDTLPNCVRSIEPVQSQNVGIIQMADVVIGAIAAKRNDVKHTSPKGELADFVLRASGRHSWTVNTAFNARFLTVWHHTTKAQVPQGPS